MTQSNKSDTSETLVESPDAGFGLIEILVSMALLMVISLFMLPVFVNSLLLANTNVSLTTATQLVSEQMDVARALSPTCAAIQTYANETTGLLVTDPKGNVLQIHRTSATTCPVSYPSALAFTTWVTRQGSTAVIATAETRIYITSAN